MSVLIYWDKGVGRRLSEEVVNSLRSVLDLPIKKVDHRFLLESDWEESTSLLVIPGGRDIPYHELLGGEGNRRISHFVEQGGNYLGICAGAYYGSALIEFEKDHPNEVCASRELAFFPGTAQGAALGKGRFHYHSDAGAAVAMVHVQMTVPFTAGVYYNGGCSFVVPEKYPAVKVLANYQSLQENSAAIVECCRGKGKAILCGVHPEVSASSLAKLSEKSHYLQQIYSDLLIFEQTREKLWSLILSSFNLF